MYHDSPLAWLYSHPATRRGGFGKTVWERGAILPLFSRPYTLWTNFSGRGILQEDFRRIFLIVLHKARFDGYLWIFQLLPSLLIGGESVSLQTLFTHGMILTGD